MELQPLLGFDRNVPHPYPAFHFFCVHPYPAFHFFCVAFKTLRFAKLVSADDHPPVIQRNNQLGVGGPESSESYVEMGFS